MKAYVISLPRSTMRRAHMAAQLGRVGLDHEFVEAVDGHALTPSARSSFVDETAVARYPHWLTPGQIGCALSHLRAYEVIIATGAEVALIFEDDVVIPSGIGASVARIAEEMRSNEIVLLYFRSFERCRFSSRDAIQIGPNIHVVFPMDVRQPITSAAYLVSRDACRGLAEAILPVRAGADSWGHFYELGAIRSLRCAVPRLVSVRKDFKSTIEYRGVESLRSRVASFVARRRLFPLYQLLTMNRHLIERRMSKTIVVQERSPIAYS